MEKIILRVNAPSYPFLIKLKKKRKQDQLLINAHNNMSIFVIFIVF